MIHSMTAFASDTTTTAQGVLTVEVRSVNHRYLDCSFKLPDSLRVLEPLLREELSGVLSRGKVECLVRLQSHAGQSEGLVVDETMLEAVLDAARLVASRLEQAARPDPVQILQFPGVYGAPEVSEEALQQTARDLFLRALEGMQETRRREGDKLAALVRDRLQQVEAQVRAVREAMPRLLQAQRDRVLARVAELDVEIDQGRLEQELVYMLQKADVDEELDRLDTHVAEVRRALDKGGPCGRRLDFLMQELNREANTLSSKSQSSATTLNAVELKVLIEQMREQIQNIE